MTDRAAAWGGEGADGEAGGQVETESNGVKVGSGHKPNDSGEKWRLLKSLMAGAERKTPGCVDVSQHKHCNRFHHECTTPDLLIIYLSSLCWDCEINITTFFRKTYMTSEPFCRFCHLCVLWLTLCFLVVFFFFRFFFFVCFLEGCFFFQRKSFLLLLLSLSPLGGSLALTPSLSMNWLP